MLTDCGWISVETELPENDKPVLVCGSAEYITVATLLRSKWWESHDWLVDGARVDSPDITHWKPLPPPPERSSK